MATQFVGGYDPNTGYPSDDSTGVQWDDNVDLPGQFGRGGFRANPKLTPPIGPSQGLTMGSTGNSLTARPASPDDLASMQGPQMTRGPQNLRPGMSPTVRNGSGPFTDVTPNGAPASGAGIWNRLGAWAPSLFGAGPAVVPALGVGAAALGYKAQPEAERMSIDPRLSAAAGIDTQPLGAAGPQPAHPSTMRYPMWPSGAAPAADPTAMPARPYTPTPTPTPRPTPRPTARVPAAAGPAAVAQQPNLGNYAPIYQPNIARTGNARGGRSGDDNAPMMGAFDFSRLFSRPPTQTGQY